MGFFQASERKILQAPQPEEMRPQRETHLMIGNGSGERKPWVGQVGFLGLLRFVTNSEAIARIAVRFLPALDNGCRSAAWSPRNFV